MLYAILRIFFVCALFVVIVYTLKKFSSNKNKKGIIVFFLVLCIILGEVFSLFPIENFFITFKSPQSAFKYYCSGEIVDIIQGDDSCMVVYSTGGNSYSHTIMPKNENGYKISSFLNTKKSISQFNSNGTYAVYNSSKTDDYYFDGMTNSLRNSILNNNFEADENTVVIFGLNDEPIFIFALVYDVQDKYIMLSNGEKILIEK